MHREAKRPQAQAPAARVRGGGNEGNLTRSRLCASSPMSWVIIRTASDIGSASTPTRPGSTQISYALSSVRDDGASSRTHHQSEPSQGGVKCRAPSGNVSPRHVISSLVCFGEVREMKPLARSGPRPILKDWYAEFQCGSPHTPSRKGEFRSLGLIMKDPVIQGHNSRRKALAFRGSCILTPTFYLTMHLV